MSGTVSLSSKDVRTVSPALEQYSEHTLLGDVWKRPDLSPRDRSIVTVAALIARNQAIEMPTHFSFALDNGVKPSELSEIVTHLAFYSGWGNAMSASAVATEVFGKHGITPDQLPPASGEHLPLDEAAEAQRAARVEQDAGAVAPGVGHTTQICVMPGYQRQGLGRRLIQSTIQSLRAQRFNALSLTVTAANQRAVALYASLGFNQIKTFTAGVWKSPDGSNHRSLFS